MEFRADATVAPVFIARGNGTCRAPVEDAVALRSIRREAMDFAGDVLVDGRRAWGSGLRYEGGGDPSEIFAVKTNVEQLLSAGDDSGGSVFHEASIARLLTLQRNTIQGGLLRATGAYDVAAVFRVTSGLCLDWACQVVAAVDRTASSYKRFNETTNAISLVMFQTHANGSRSPVPMMDAGLLSLGRAVMADLSWQDPTGRGQEPLLSRLSLRVAPSSREGDVLPPMLRNLTVVRAPSRSRWAQVVAYVLCAPPVGSFVRDPQLCVGMPAPLSQPPDPSWFEGKQAFAYRSRRVTGRGRVASWMMYRAARGEANDAPTADPADLDPGTTLIRRPEWLAGLGSREVARDSPDEIALAKRISVKWVPHRYWPTHRAFANREPVSAKAIALSQDYDQTLFSTAPPDPPATDSELLLAVIVVAPELVALVVVLITTSTWRRRDLVVLAFVFGTGLVSMAGIWALLHREMRGAVWRAAGVRDTLTLAFPGEAGAASMVGEEVTRIETLFLTARTGYRVDLLRKITLGMSATYVVASSVVAAAVWMLNIRRANHRNDREATPPTFPAAASTAAATATGRRRKAPRLRLAVTGALRCWQRVPSRRRAAPPTSAAASPLPPPTAGGPSSLSTAGAAAV